MEASAIVCSSTRRLKLDELLNYLKSESWETHIYIGHLARHIAQALETQGRNVCWTQGKETGPGSKVGSWL